MDVGRIISSPSLGFRGVVKCFSTQAVKPTSSEKDTIPDQILIKDYHGKTFFIYIYLHGLIVHHKTSNMCDFVFSQFQVLKSEFWDIKFLFSGRSKLP